MLPANGVILLCCGLHLMGSLMMSARAGQKEIVVLFTAFICVVYGFGIYLFPAVVESIRRDIDFSYGTMGGFPLPFRPGSSCPRRWRGSSRFVLAPST